MRQQVGPAAVSIAALIFIGFGAAPALAQETPQPVVAEPAVAAPAQPPSAAERPLQPAVASALEPAVVAAPVEAMPAALTAEPASAAAAAAVTVVADPVIAEIRSRFARASLALSKEERQALVQYYAIEGVKPLWVTELGPTARGLAVRGELQRADDWGLRSADFDMGPALDGSATIGQIADWEIKLVLAVFKYARHARGGRVDPTLLSTYLDRKAQLLPAKRVFDELTASAAPDAYLRGLHPQHPQFEKLRQAYLAMRTAAAAPSATDASMLIPTATTEAVSPAPAKSAAKAKTTAAALPERGSLRKLVANMEMWRWMPADLGATHLLVNVPEFQFRLTRNGRVVHTERVITGKTETQTPIFSDMMETVVFKPTWNVPDSIKVKELLPALSKNPQALARQGLRVAYQGKEIDPTTIDWATTDIRALHVFQPPSGDNALGIVKFLFPNKHAVYLHDTPTKALFNSTRRIFSHGCIRVRNPVRLAEVLMEGDRNWTPAQVAQQLASAAPENNHTNLTKKFPVHIAYFTAWANEAGEVQYFSDVYGYENSIHLGLDGKAHLIVLKKDEDLGPIRAATVAPIAAARPSGNVREWSKKAFGDN